MARDDDDDDYFEDDDDDASDPAEGALALGHAIEDAYVGDTRFSSVDLVQPGPLEGEVFRVRLIVDDHSHFMVSVLPDLSMVRVGLSTDDQEISEAIEAHITDSADSMTDFLAQAMNEDEDPEHEMEHFHDDTYYFCSDIPYDADEQLARSSMRDTVVLYLDGYIEALSGLLEDQA